MIHPLVLRGARILTCDATHTVLDADVAIAGDRIVAIGPDLRGEREIDCAGRWLLPGFVQTHVHLVQTLFRGLADDLLLLDWLRTRIWPLERAHEIGRAHV